MQSLVAAAIEEDLAGQQDITALLVPAKQLSQAHVITREDVVICGQAWVDEVLRQIDPKITATWQYQDGELATANNVIYKLSGATRSLLTAERTALNFLQLLSGIATTTHKYVQQLKGTKAKLLDSRKTIPGLRAAQKYAVRCGGGHNHRMGLYDAFLIKENHIQAAGSIAKVIQTARTIAPTKPIEIEVENLTQLQQAIAAQADTVMLDNFTIEQLQQAITINHGQLKLEASGNITLTNIKQVATTGVDFISVGALTKNIKASDFSMLFIK